MAQHLLSMMLAAWIHYPQYVLTRLHPSSYNFKMVGPIFKFQSILKTPK